MDPKIIIRCIANSIKSGTIFHKSFNYLLNYWEIKIGKQKLISRPISSIFSTISVCNYKCKFCESNSMLKNAERIFPNSISLEDFKKLKYFGKSTMAVYFYGNIGEPLLNKDFGEIAKILKKKGIYLDITTNGSLLTPELSNKLIKIGFDHILVSFHAGKKETYENIQNKTFDIVINNIAYLAKNKKIFPRVFFNFALNKINAKEIPDLLNLTRRLKIDGILLNHYYHCNNAFDKDISFQDNPKEGNEFVKQLYELGNKAKVEIIPTKRPYLKNDPVKIKKTNKVKCKCKMPFQNLNFYGSFSKDKTFDVCVCNRFFPFRLNWEKFGSQDIDLVWNHPILQYLRETIGKNSICEFCQDKKTPRLRNLDNKKYQEKRDEAIKKFLYDARKVCETKPIKGLEILENNIYGK